MRPPPSAAPDSGPASTGGSAPTPARASTAAGIGAASIRCNCTAVLTYGSPTSASAAGPFPVPVSLRPGRVRARLGWPISSDAAARIARNGECEAATPAANPDAADAASGGEASSAIPTTGGASGIGEGPAGTANSSNRPASSAPSADHTSRMVSWNRPATRA